MKTYHDSGAYWSIRGSEFLLRPKPWRSERYTVCLWLSCDFAKKSVMKTASCIESPQLCSHYVCSTTKVALSIMADEEIDPPKAPLSFAAALAAAAAAAAATTTAPDDESSTDVFPVKVPAAVASPVNLDLETSAAPPPSAKQTGPFPLAPSQVDQVIKRALPQGFHVSKDAKAALNKSANIFLLYIETLISAEKLAAQSSKRHPPKRITISAADVKQALQDAGMTHLLPQMTSNKRSR